MSESVVWIWGRHPVLEAIQAGTARSVIIAEGRAASAVLDRIRSSAAEKGVPVRDVPRAEVERRAPGENTQGVAAQVSRRQVDSVESLLRSAPPPAFVVALDQVQDPHNMGAILRTAEAAGIAGVIVPERRSAPLSGTVAKVSAGAVNHLAIVGVRNLSRALDELREEGVWTVGLAGTARQTIYDVDLTMPLALIIGGEGQGLRRLTRHHCDLLVRLPMFGHVESLNASVAASIAMYEVVRQRLTAHAGS